MMNWTNFLLTLTLIYLTYYGLNVLYDLLLAGRSPTEDKKGDMLYFEEEVTPELVVLAQDSFLQDIDDAHEEALIIDPYIEQSTPAAHQQDISRSVTATGAVGLKELFNLAKGNLIEYTGEIKY